MITENENYRNVAKAARKLWTIHACIRALFFAGITIGVYFIAYKHIWIFIPAGLYIVFGIFIMPAIEYRQWLYFIGEDRIETIHGIFFKKRALIPINRIQHLRINQGILQKKFDLATVDIFTAGGAHDIKAVTYAEADEIVRKLNHLVTEEEPKDIFTIEKEVCHDA